MLLVEVLLGLFQLLQHQRANTVDQRLHGHFCYFFMERHHVVPLQSVYCHSSALGLARYRQVTLWSCLVYKVNEVEALVHKSVH